MIPCDKAIHLRFQSIFDPSAKSTVNTRMVSGLPKEGTPMLTAWP